ncbi:hypothetical protein CDD82_7043 [Ophiocordyceps australis]|uniref:Major facilitator superfamily (MFS) profile domain-containing protein n=1 Tax=Ophiocordyceps australis TaxID=1399860 RepID=A0A2C5YU59_9HYPO|nr:hypothetical protein CDD82_7043 [Ophiocordyceps australis]
MFCILFGWTLLLLPFSLVNTAPHGWKTGYILASIVLGIALLAAFAVWERFFAAVSYFPWSYLKNRTILCANLVYFFMFLSIQTWDTYYSSYLQVVHFLDVTASGYVVNTFSLSAAFFGPFIGLLVRYTGDYKYISLAGIPFGILGTALLIKFRTPDSSVGLLAMCQIMQGLYTEIWSLTARLAIMAAVGHQQVAVALAIFGLFGSIGSGVGRAIAGAIWTNTLPRKLHHYLPDEAKHREGDIYNDITLQLSFPRGSPERDAIIAAYSDVQRTLVIIGVCFMPVLLLCLIMWKNVNVKKFDAVQGKRNAT